jgi:hypothetical protein
MENFQYSMPSNPLVVLCTQTHDGDSGKCASRPQAALFCWKRASQKPLQFLVAVLAPLVVGVVEFLHSQHEQAWSIGLRLSAYLGERDIGDDDNVESRRGVLLDAGVTARVVLVGAVAFVVTLPGLAVGSLGNSSLRRGAGGRAGYNSNCKHFVQKGDGCASCACGLQKCHPARPKMPLMMARSTCS